MQYFVRIIIAIAVFLMTTVFSNILVSLLLPQTIGYFASILSWAAAFLVARYVWRQMENSEGSGLLSHIASGACILGAIGFAGGFFGPMIFAPDANQGPLLGIFITGPAGFLLGAFAGWGWWYTHRSEA